MHHPEKLPNDDKRKQIQSMDINSLTVFLFRWLKENLNTDSPYRRDYCSIGNLRQYLFPGGPRDNNSEEDHIKLSEAIVNLERRQLLVRVFNCPRYSSSHQDPIICLTAIGMKSDVDDGVLLLVDNPEESVAALEHEIGRIDDVVRQYYLESLRAYQEELYISSVICLGAASERAIHWLAGAIETNFQNYQTEIQKKRNGSIAGLTKYLCDSVVPNIPNYDKSFAKELVKRLDGLAIVYRENRNEAGHPQRIEQSWLNEDQGGLLQYFRKYITTISKAVEKVVPQAQPRQQSSSLSA